MKLHNFLAFLLLTVLSLQANRLLAEVYRQDLIELEELNLVADEIIGPLLRTLILVRLKNLLYEKKALRESGLMKAPDKAFRILESNNKDVFKSMYDCFIFLICFEDLQNSMSWCWAATIRHLKNKDTTIN